MNTYTAALNAIQEEATTIVARQCTVGLKTFVRNEYKGFASGEINGHEVSCSLIDALRSTGRKTRPGVYWKVDGKRVKAADLNNALSA